MPTTPARDELLSLFANRQCGKTEAARLIDAALAEDRASARQEAAEVRVAVLTEAIQALTTEARNLSQQADDEMRRDLEDKAQIWHEAAGTLRRLPASPSPDNTGDPT